MVVQHNLTAMNSNRMLGITQGAQAKSSEKLSSGFQINRAADDAAGLSISEKMRKQINGLDRASTNAQDGVSAVQTAEGALTEVHSMLQRMNELAVQAANGTNSKEDRDAIQNEIDQLSTEIDRVAETTKFNETYLLKGNNATKTVNINAHDAGLKGTLVQGAGDKSTFTMDLNIGESVSIAGADYRLYNDSNELTKVQTKVAAATDNVTIDGTTYKFDAGKETAADKPEDDFWTDSNGNVYTADQLSDLVGDGSSVIINGKDADTGKAIQTSYNVVDMTADDAKTINQAIKLVENALADASSIGGTTKTATAKLQAEEEAPIPDPKDVDDAIAAAMQAAITNLEGQVSPEPASIDMEIRNQAEALLIDKGTGAQTTTLEVKLENGTPVTCTVSGTVTSGGAIDASGITYSGGANTPGDIVQALNLTKEDIGKTVTIGNGSTVVKAATAPVSATIKVGGADYTVTADVDEASGALENIQWNETEENILDEAHAQLEVGETFTIVGVDGQTKDITVTELEQDEELLDSGTYTFDIEKATTTVQKDLTFSLHVGADADMNNKINVNVAAMDSAGLGIKGINVADNTGVAATYAIDAIADAVAKVSEQRSALGAVQNRLEHTIANLDNVVENTTAAESRIRDTDMAEEMVEFSKNNILAQAGQSMLAQANQATQGVLSILR